MQIIQTVWEPNNDSHFQYHNTALQRCAPATGKNRSLSIRCGLPGEWRTRDTNVVTDSDEKWNSSSALVPQQVRDTLHRVLFRGLRPAKWIHCRLHNFWSPLTVQSCRLNSSRSSRRRSSSQIGIHKPERVQVFCEGNALILVNTQFKIQKYDLHNANNKVYWNLKLCCNQPTDQQTPPSTDRSGWRLGLSAFNSTEPEMCNNKVNTSRIWQSEHVQSSPIRQAAVPVEYWG